MNKTTNPYLFWPLLLIAIVVVTAGLRSASNILAPSVLGLVLGIVVAPAADKLERKGVPRIAVSIGIVVIALAVITALILSLGPVFGALADALPRIQYQVREWLEMVRELMQGLEAVGENLAGAGAEAKDEDLPSVMDAVWMAPNLGAQIFIILGMLFFFTLTRNEIYSAFPDWHPRLRQAERTVARYFSVVTIINLGLGVCVMLVMAALGMSNAPLWGAAAGILNFLLYLGPLVMFGSLLVGGFTEFVGFYSLVPAVVFITMNMIEAQFVTPTLLGKRLDMNPLLVFFAVVFGLWVWGPMGAIVSLPVVIWCTVTFGSLPAPKVEKPAAQAQKPQVS